jgi:serine/threonine protein kinase
MANLNWLPTKREPLGQGGLGVVTLVSRGSVISPEVELGRALRELQTADDASRPGLIEKVGTYLRAILNADDALAAKKQLINPDDESRARLAREVEVYEAISNPHLLRVLDNNLHENWIITEYQPLGSLDKRLKEYRGDVLGALKAIRPLVGVLAEMHRLNFVHRDRQFGRSP